MPFTQPDGAVPYSQKHVTGSYSHVQFSSSHPFHANPLRMPRHLKQFSPLKFHRLIYCVQITLFWDVAPYILIEFYRYLKHAILEQNIRISATPASLIQHKQERIKQDNVKTGQAIITPHITYDKYNSIIIRAQSSHK